MGRDVLFYKIISETELLVDLKSSMCFLLISNIFFRYCFQAVFAVFWIDVQINLHFLIFNLMNADKLLN